MKCTNILYLFVMDTCMCPFFEIELIATVLSL
jgi:hypothetical protein